MKYKKTVIGVVVLSIVAAGAVMYLRKENNQPAIYRTAAVTRGDLLVSISATGTVEPEEVINIGAQIAGQIVKFGQDRQGKPIDYGSMVEAGMVLAQIDDSLYAADAAQAEAQVEVNRAALAKAEADIEQLKAKFVQAQRDWERAQKLGPSEALSVTSYDAYQAGYETTRANVAVGRAAIAQAKAAVSQSEALLRRARRNLGYCTIKSPVNGVIIDRRVNIGQTVVASLNAPSLFLIAKDLKRMQVWVAVNEADIGKIRPGQGVSFTVDAFPGETYRGEVGKIRLNASMTQNVITYIVEVITDNSSGRLLPYLTANVQFEIERKNDTLLVPNAALRWTPPVERIAPEFRKAGEKAIAKDGRSEEPKADEKSDKAPVEGRKRTTLWVLRGEFVEPLRVKTGLSDGTMTAVKGEGLTEGMEVVTGLQTQAAGQSGTANPFIPQFGRSRGGGR